MKTKNPTPTIEDENAALVQEINFLKDRARMFGKTFSESMIQITDQTKQMEELKRDNDRLRKQLTDARMA